MTETAERASTTIRTIRMYDDAWGMIGTRSRDHSTFIRDMSEAGVDCARCYRCFTLVPVQFGDLTGKPLAEWVAEAGKTVTAQHRHGHHPIVVGRGAGSRVEPARPSPGSVVFMEPGGKPVITAPVPDRKKERRT